jgi:hypothetical protein
MSMSEKSSSGLKVVYNACYGGFSLSDEACKVLGYSNYRGRGIDRTDPRLVLLLEEWGSERVSGKHSRLQIETIPHEWSGCYIIDEYDGDEVVRLDKFEWLKIRLRSLASIYPVVEKDIGQILTTLDQLENF